MMTKNNKPQPPPSYRGKLNAEQASAAFQASRLTALDLLQTADLLFNSGRFAHSCAFSILAIEEAGKYPIIQCIFLGLGGVREKLWIEYKQHQSKTRHVPTAITSRIRAILPQVPLHEARFLGEVGPTPPDMDVLKQRALYSDCLEMLGGFFLHSPGEIDWRHHANFFLSDARAIVTALRDYPAAELEVWLKHAKQAQAKGQRTHTMLEGLQLELLEKGFIKEGWWDTMLADLRTDLANSEG